MALRRRQTILMEEKTYSSSSSLAAQALMIHSSPKDHHYKGGPTYDYTSMEGSNDEGSFWGVLARKAKAMIDEDSTVPYQSEYLTQTRPETVYQAHDQTHKIQIRRNGNNEGSSPLQNHTSKEDLIKASRDVAMATAAKVKQLLRELKTVKADLAFSQQRCSQLEEENKVLREGREKGVFHGDDDMIRLQLETLLAEKARLAHENSVYDSENRFLREVVEYHQLTMQDVVYLDEGIEEVTEVYDYTASRCNSVSSSLSRASSVAKEMMSMSMSAAAP